jgi:hypothetical protein
MHIRGRSTMPILQVKKWQDLARGNNQIHPQEDNSMSAQVIEKYQATPIFGGKGKGSAVPGVTDCARSNAPTDSVAFAWSVNDELLKVIPEGGGGGVGELKPTLPAILWPFDIVGSFISEPTPGKIAGGGRKDGAVPAPAGVAWDGEPIAALLGLSGLL